MEIPRGLGSQNPKFKKESMGLNWNFHRGWGGGGGGFKLKDLAQFDICKHNFI